jgi:hypothetical protein
MEHDSLWQAAGVFTELLPAAPNRDVLEFGTRPLRIGERNGARSQIVERHQFKMQRPDDRRKATVKLAPARQRQPGRI